MALVVKNPPANAGDLRDVELISGSGRSPEEGNGNPLQYSCLENPIDRGVWRATVHGFARVGHDWSNLAQHSTSLESSTFYYQMRWLSLLPLEIYTLPSPHLCIGRLTFTRGTPRLPFPLSSSCMWSLWGTSRRWETRKRKSSGCLFLLYSSSLAVFVAVAIFLYNISSHWTSASPWLPVLEFQYYYSSSPYLGVVTALCWLLLHPLLFPLILLASFNLAVPNLLGTRNWFHEDIFPWARSKGDETHYIYCIVYFYYYYISSTSDHHTLDLRGGGHLL